jgi:hypothetical protein
MQWPNKLELLFLASLSRKLARNPLRVSSWTFPQILDQAGKVHHGPMFKIIL